MAVGAGVAAVSAGRVVPEPVVEQAASRIAVVRKAAGSRRRVDMAPRTLAHGGPVPGRSTWAMRTPRVRRGPELPRPTGARILRERSTPARVPGRTRPRDTGARLDASGHSGGVEGCSQDRTSSPVPRLRRGIRVLVRRAGLLREQGPDQRPAALPDLPRGGQAGADRLAGRVPASTTPRSAAAAAARLVVRPPPRNSRAPRRPGRGAPSAARRRRRRRYPCRPGTCDGSSSANPGKKVLPARAPGGREPYAGSVSAARRSPWA